MSIVGENEVSSSPLKKRAWLWLLFQRLISSVLPASSVSEEEGRRARLLARIIFAMLATAIIAFILGLLEPKNDLLTTVIFWGLVFVAIGAFIILLKRGKINVAGWCLIVFLWIIIAFASIFFGGLRGQIPVVFVVVIMFMGSFLGGRPAFILALITILFLGLVTVLDSQHLMPVQLGPAYSPINAWSALCVAFLLMSVLLNNSLQSIKESQERYQLAMTGSAAGLWDWNIMNNEVYYAPGFKEMLGYTPDEFTHVFLSLTSSIHQDDYQMAMAMLNSHLKSPYTKYDIELRLRTKTGEYRWFHSRGEALRNREGTPYRMVGSIADITKRKLDEESIALKNHELLKINEELDRFVYSASHDLRAPISSLLGLIRVARLENDPSSLKRLFDMQERSLHRLDNFIYDIVNYSRNNRVELDISKIDFAALLADCYEQLFHMERVSEINRIIQIEPGIIFYSDKKRLSIVLNNLISNAIKYSDLSKDDALIEITVKRSEDGVSIHIIDNGEGIEEDHIRKIFEMFFRGSERSVGSGIGLYIVKEVVEKLKGTVEVKSQKNIGSEFIVHLADLTK